MKILETIFDRFDNPYSLLEFLKAVQSQLVEGQTATLDYRIVERTGEIGITFCTKSLVVCLTVDVEQGKILPTRIEVSTAEEFVSHLEAVTQSLERSEE